MSNIYYNNFLVGSGQPTPYVARSVQPIFRGDGRRLGFAENYQLVGQITGCHFAIITGYQAYINNIFSRDFGLLSLQDDDGFIVNVSGCKVNNISYEEGSMVGMQNYTVDLTAYPQTYFETAGIIEKKNEWSVSQEENQNLTISHTIYAKGCNTAPSFNNALNNAKNFVLLYTGFTPPTLFPFFISGFSGSLDSRTETINRLEGSYQIVENYVGRTGTSISQELSVNLESGIDGIITVSVNGSFKGGKNDNFTALRLAYSGLDIFSTATGVYNDYRGATGLFSTPLASGVTEDYKENSLNFDISFIDWPNITYKHVYNVQISSGIDGIITASIDGNIQGFGKMPTKYDNAYNFYKTLDMLSLVNPEYNAYVGAGYPYSLNAYPLSSGTTLDRFGGTIGYNASFSDKPLAITGSGLQFFDVTFSKDYQMRQISPISIPNSISGLDTMDLLWNKRGSLTINGNLKVLKPLTTIDATGFVANYINNTVVPSFQCTNKTNVRLDAINLSQVINTNECNFSITYSFDEALPINPLTSYTLITGLVI